MANSSRLWATASVVVLSLFSAACAGTHYNGFSEEHGAQIAIAQNPLINGGILEPEVMQIAFDMSDSCRYQLKPQMASAGQSAVTGAVEGGIVGGAATGANASVFAVPSLGTYIVGGVVDGAIRGADQGMQEAAWQISTGTAECAKIFVDQLNMGLGDGLNRELAGKMDGLAIVSVPAGKAWGDTTPPALRKVAKTSSDARGPATE